MSINPKKKFGFNQWLAVLLWAWALFCVVTGVAKLNSSLLFVAVASIIGGIIEFCVHGKSDKKDK